MATNLPEAAALLKLPEDVVIEHGITVISYLDEDGKQCFDWVIHGDPLLSTVLGLLVMAEHALAIQLLGDT